MEHEDEGVYLMSNMSATDLAELRATVLGPVLTPDNGGYDQPSPFWVGGATPDYDQARKLWNGLVDRRPDLIVQCQGVSDVQAALAFARAHGIVVAVRSGGHGPFGAAMTDGGMVIDLTRLRGVHVDVERRTAVAAAGSLLAELDRETQVHGLATTAGTVSHTGIAGLTLFGGVGRLMRKHGLTVDNVIGFNVVTADGRALRVDADSHPDLFWALRGGGTTFCIVTHIEYQLHPVGPLVYGGYLGWPLEQAKDVYLAIREQIANAPDELQVQFIFVNAPVVGFVPPELQGKPCLMMTATYVGDDLDEGARLIAPLQEQVPPILNVVGAFPYTFLQSASDALAPHGLLAVDSMCGYLADLTEDVFDTALELATSAPTPATVIEISLMGGATKRVPADATPLGLAREAGYFYIVGANAIDPVDIDVCRTWTAEASATMDRHRLAGRYLNFVSSGDDETVQAAYGEQAWARLSEVKATYDPDGTFSYDPNRRSAAPATAGAGS